jgi:ribonuclease HI/catechol 2,3-dioxygenase-like lactoylglutathione lyase family enzyme
MEVDLRRLQRQAAEGADRHRQLKAKLSTDGGARGNPGPAAFAYVLEAADGQVLAAHGEAIGRATNNVAEYRGLLAGMRKAADVGVRELEVVSDSELLVKQMRGDYRVKNEALRELWEEASDLERRFARVGYTAVRREHNELADRLVNEALDAQAEPGRRQLRLDHIVIAVSDWERSNRFYRDVLGAEIVERGDGYAYRVGDQQLNVHGPGAAASIVASDPVRPGNSDLCFVWPGSTEEAVEHLQRHGIDVELGPVERGGARGMGRSVYFRDPDGTLLELLSYEQE